MKDVENFIKRFHSSDSIDEVFTESCSYWFAAVLFRRFIRQSAEIMYNETTGRFGTRVRNRVYDITGDVTDKYRWILWESYTNDLQRREMVVRDNIMF